jgi:hypothetical protein
MQQSTIAMDTQMQTLQAQAAIYQSMLSTIQTLNGQISAAGLVPQNTTTSGSTTNKAFGGSVNAGQRLIVGERGPEVFMPGEDGWIAPVAQARALGTGRGGGDTYIVNVYPQGNVVTDRDLVEHIRSELLKTARRNVTGGPY